MRYLFLVLLMLAVSGCSLPLNSSLMTAPAQGPTLGMTRAQVSAMMTKTVVVGYEIDPSTGAPKPIEAKSLYSTEVVSVGTESYLVDSYITDALRTGHPVTDSVLIPMIFKNDILCGKGRDTFSAIKAGAKL